MTLQIKWKKLTQAASIPTKAHATDAGMDMRVLVPSPSDESMKEFCPRENKNKHVFVETLYDPDLGTSTKGCYILPHTTVIFHTGLTCAVPEGYYLEVNPRSSLGFKNDIMLANTTGIIDCHYRGELLVALYNNSNELRIIEDNERVVQCMLKKVEDVENIEVEELDETDRGTGGFGSSGTK